jgi:hypothetical protein
MRAQLVLAAVLLTSCATQTQVTGRYAASLSANDLEQIRRLARIQHIGRTIITVNAISRDRVHVEERRYDSEGWHGSGFFVIRRGGTWQIDEHSEFTAESKFITY